MLDLPPDADDEAMMELAIALSLQEQGSVQGLQLSESEAQGLVVEAGVALDTASGNERGKIALNTVRQCLTII